MEIDGKKLASLDDATLARLIYDVTRSMGLPEERCRRMAGNAPALRLMLSRASEEELKRVLSTIGETKAAEILASIDKEKRR